VITGLIDRRGTIETAVDGLLANNDRDSPLPAATFIEWLRTLHQKDIEPLADKADVSVATFRRVLSQYDSEIKTALADEFDDIKHYAPWLETTGTE